MDTETMIRNLKCVEEQHKDDKVFTGQLNISQMAHDVRRRLEELKPYEDTGLTPPEIMELKERDTVKAPERADEQPYFRKHFQTMICPVCPRKIGETWKICAYCGQRLTESLLMDYIMRHTYSCPVKDDADIDFEKECAGFKEPGCRECIMRHLKELR